MSSGRRGGRWSLRAVAAAVGAPTTEVREVLAAEIADERVEGAKGGRTHSRNSVTGFLSVV